MKGSGWSFIFIFDAVDSPQGHYVEFLHWQEDTP
jgi:hypothetical protein